MSFDSARPATTCTRLEEEELCGGPPGALSRRASSAYLAGAFRRMERLKGGLHSVRRVQEWAWSRRFIAIYLGLTVTWIFAGTVFYHVTYRWTLAEAWYYTVSAGLSIGWNEGLLAEDNDSSRLFTIMLILMGSSVVAGALNLFVGYVVVRQRAITRRAYEEREHLAHVRQLAAGEGGAEAKVVDVQVDVEAQHQHQHHHHLHGETPAALWEDMRKLQQWSTSTYDKNKELINAAALVLLWVSLGTVYSCSWYGFSVIQGVYFSIATMSTAGLQGIAYSKGGWAIAGCFAFFGVPIYAYFCAMLAARVLQYQVAHRVKLKMERHDVSPEEFEFASMLICDNKKMDFAEFLILELLRLDVTDLETIYMIHTKFRELDKDGSGYIEMHDISV